jgi:membrane-associated phospholipid phosphatase
MREGTIGGANRLPRRAIVASPLIGVVTFAIMLVAANSLDLPVNDPDGSVLGSPLNLIAAVMALFIALDVVPRAILRERREHTRFRPTAMALLRERWTWRRLGIVVAALLGFYLTYVGYRNLKSFLPFANDETLHDDALLELDRDMAFGNDPGTLMQDILGTGVAAHVLSFVYLAYLLLVPVSLGIAVVWQRKLHRGLWYVAAVNLSWILGVASYYVVPSLGPIFAEPELYSALPETGVSRLQEALVEHRAEVIADPNAAEGVQSIAGFASLHIAIVFAAALVAQLLGLKRWVRVTLWAFLGLTFLATIYFGWHYIVDDIAGVAIGALAVVLGAWMTGHPLRRPSPSDEDEADVVGGRGGEQERVDPVEHAAVGAEQRAAVLHAGGPLEERLEEVPERGRNGDGQAEQQGLGGVEPRLPDRGGADDGRRADDDAGDEALDRLGR